MKERGEVEKEGDGLYCTYNRGKGKTTNTKEKTRH